MLGKFRIFGRTELVRRYRLTHSYGANYLLRWKQMINETKGGIQHGPAVPKSASAASWLGNLADM